MKIPKWLIFIFAVVIVVAGGVYLYKNNQSSEAAENDVRYKEFTVSRGTFQTEVSATGVVTPIDRVEIKSKASGRIDELPIEEGDYVKKGQLICKLDPTDVQAEVDQAKANLEIAEAELTTAQNTHDRQIKLFEKGLISAEARDQASLALAQAKGKMVSARISLDQADTRLSETIVQSPIDGVILQKYVEVGQIIASGISNVSGGTPIADVASMANVYVEAGIDEIDVGKINIGQPAKVVAEAYPRMTFHGKIIRIAPEATVEQNVTLFNVVIEVENKDGKLKSGMNATAEITVAREDNVLLVPTLALSPVQGPDSRFTRRTFLKQGNEYIPQDVEIGLSDFKETVVQSGLKEGDIVGVPMVSRLKEQNDEMEQRIRSSRSFGTSGSNSSSRGGR
jgi:HlyD family secretion protein